MRSTAEVLLEGIRAGQFGGDIEPHGEHAMGFVAFLDEPETQFSGHVVDLGSGAGLPALILADAFPATTWSLVERRAGRTDLLRRAIARLDLDDRVEVLTTDAAALAHGELRSAADWVTSRSFGPPADTAECALGFLRAGGRLLASEPDKSVLSERWPTSGLTQTGFVFDRTWQTAHGRYIALERTAVPLMHLPRAGARKRLLF